MGNEESRVQRAAAARPLLIDTAGEYRGVVVTHKELADKVQARSGIRTKQLTKHWLGDVLGLVARDGEARDEPLLSALCVNALGSVGTGTHDCSRGCGGPRSATPTTMLLESGSSATGRSAPSCRPTADAPPPSELSAPRSRSRSGRTRAASRCARRARRQFQPRHL